MLEWYCVGLSSPTYLGETVTYFKALSKDTSIFSYRKRTCGSKRRKMLSYNLHRRWNLSINVRAWHLLLVSLYLRFAFHVWIFFTFGYLSWATLWDVAFSDYYESISFHVGSSAFPQNFSSHCGTMTWANDMQ